MVVTTSEEEEHMAQCKYEEHEAQHKRQEWKRVILCQLSQPVNPPSRIFFKFHKQIKLLVLIPKN